MIAASSVHGQVCLLRSYPKALCPLAFESLGRKVEASEQGLGPKPRQTSQDRSDPNQSPQRPNCEFPRIGDPQKVP